MERCLAAACFGAEFAAANFFKAVLDGADVDRADLSGVRFLDCAQLTAARNWRSAYRDEHLECGAPGSRETS